MSLTKAHNRMIQGATLNVLDFGAVGDGVTDDSAAIRLALDNVPDQGGAIFFPSGKYYVPTTVYIPQRRLGAGEPTTKGRGIHITGDNALIIGNNNVIFESGTGTVSTGGSTNWNLTPDTPATLHFNNIIDGLTFSTASTAIKVFNFVQNCAVTNCFFDNCVTSVQCSNCFLFDLRNCASVGSTSIGSNDIIYNFDTANNNMHIEGVSGQSGSGTGIVFSFTGSTFGNLISNCDAESARVGIQFDGGINNTSIIGNYIEGVSIGIFLGDNTKTGVYIDGNRIQSSLFNIQSTGDFVRGYIGPNNSFVNANDIEITGSSNTAIIELAKRNFPNTGSGNHTTRTHLPSGWSVPDGCVLRTNDSIYNASTGLNAPMVNLASGQLANGLIPFHCSGQINDNHFGLIPLATITDNTDPGPGTLVIDTAIVYGTYDSGVRFDFTVIDSASTGNFSGIIVAGNIVFRDDSETETITASNNSGFLRITIGNFSSASITGKVRIV